MIQEEVLAHDPAGGQASQAHKPFVADESVVVIDKRGHKNLLTLEEGKKLHVTEGSVEADSVIGAPPGLRVRTNKGEVLAIFRPTLEEYLVLMPRAAQIVTPKDVALLTQWADVFAGATVVEAGLGSGALTIGLLTAVGVTGRVLAFETRDEFANCGLKNVKRWSPALFERLTLHREDVHSALAEHSGVDSVVLDLADPWESIDGAAAALVSGGIFACYVPTIRQVDQLVIAILDHRAFAPPEVKEALERPWLADRVRLRPATRMTGHTGFLVRTRRLGPPPAPRARR